LLKTLALNIDIVVTVVCAGVWAFAGFPHFTEVAPAVGLAAAVVGGFTLLTWHPKD
jgi:hypothetical protein